MLGGRYARRVTDPRYGQVVRGAPLSYVSDYFSFVGGDEHGRVAFALDNNRGFDSAPRPRGGLRGQRFQADHGYAVLHDEFRGWVSLVGIGRYPHPGGDVTALPDSPWFTFTGSQEEGMTVQSRPNDLTLQVEPLADRMVRRDASTLFTMRSAAAVLRWRGRTLTGRVIFEGLASTRINMLSRRSFAGLGGLEFLYLLVGDGKPGGDLYLQKSLGDGALAGMEPELGFSSGRELPSSEDGELPNLTIRTTAHAPALGFYRWPTAWAARWSGAAPTTLALGGRAELRTLTRTVVGRYGIAGFAMAVVRGTVTSEPGRTLPLYGFAELLAGGPLLRIAARRSGQRASVR